MSLLMTWPRFRLSVTADLFAGGLDRNTSSASLRSASLKACPPTAKHAKLVSTPAAPNSTIILFQIVGTPRTLGKSPIVINHGTPVRFLNFPPTAMPRAIDSHLINAFLWRRCQSQQPHVPITLLLLSRILLHAPFLTVCRGSISLVFLNVYSNLPLC